MSRPDDRRRAPAPARPDRDPVALATAPARAVGHLVTGVAYTAYELPHLVRDLRLLVGELTRAAGPGGELSRLLAATADLASARADVERRRAVA